MPKQTKATWEMARGWYEKKGLSQKAIAEKLGVAEGSVHNHVKKEGWIKGTETPGPVPDELVAETSARMLRELESDFEGRLDLMRQELAAKEAELVEQRKLVDEYRPTADVSGRLFLTPEDVENHLGAERLRDMAEREFAIENQKRWREGLPHLELTEEQYIQNIERIKIELVADRDRWTSTEGPQMRVLKMVKPDGTLVQIPVENQINNQAGSLYDGTGRYKDKKFKLADPFLCAMKDCWQEAAIDSAGRFTNNGYCSPAHEQRVEQIQGSGYVSDAVGV